MEGVSVGGGACLNDLTTLIRWTLIISIRRILACMASEFRARKGMGVSSCSVTTPSFAGTNASRRISNSLELTSLLLLSVYVCSEWVCDVCVVCTCSVCVCDVCVVYVCSVCVCDVCVVCVRVVCGCVMCV